MKKKGMNKMVEIITPVEKNRKPIIIGVITVSIILLLAAALFLNARQPIAGKAFQIAPGSGITTETVNTVWVPFSLAYAAQNDTFSIDVMFKTGSSDAVTGATFTLTYDTANFEFVSAPAGNGFQLLTDPNTISSGSSIALMSTTGVSGTARLVTLNFRATGAYNDVEAQHPFTFTFTDFSGVNLGNTAYPIVDTTRSSLSTMANIIIAQTCDDTDNDGYGQTGTDLRACPNLGSKDGTGATADCNDNLETRGAIIYPGAVEACDGVINNCNALDAIDGSGVDAPSTTLQQGICFGLEQQCITGTWADNYATQLGEKYQESETTCDFYDNDCDGAVNQVNVEGVSSLAGCMIGGGTTGPSAVGTIASAIPGNVYIDYDTGDMHTVPQLFEISDRLLYNLLWSTRGLADCGVATKKPCDAAFDANTQVWFCRNNVYYVVAGGTVTKHSADGLALTVTAATVNDVPVCS